MSVGDMKITQKEFEAMTALELVEFTWIPEGASIWFVSVISALSLAPDPRSAARQLLSCHHR